MAVTLNVVQSADPSYHDVPVLCLIRRMTYMPTMSIPSKNLTWFAIKNPVVSDHDLRPAITSVQSPAVAEEIGMDSHPTCNSSLLVAAIASPLRITIMSLPFNIIRMYEELNYIRRFLGRSRWQAASSLCDLCMLMVVDKDRLVDCGGC